MPPIDGVAMSAALEQSLARRVEKLSGRTLAILQVGDNPASTRYIARKRAACERIGLQCIVEELPRTATLPDVAAVLNAWNDDASIAGMLVQLPLPSHLPLVPVCSLIAPHKDVDCLHPENFGLLFCGAPRVVPCTARAVLELLDAHHVPLSGARVCVVGNGVATGRPIAVLCSERGATVTVCTDKTADLVACTRTADVLISATGVPSLITEEHVREGAVLIDIGFAFVDGKVRGDIDPSAYARASLWTPVPGGVGPVTVVMALANVLDLAQRVTRGH